MIGTLEEARIIFDANEQHWRSFDGELPPGWEFIGSGGTRRVYRSPSGVVYKVNYSNPEDEPTYNDLEFNNFRRIEPSLPDRWRVPRSHVYRFYANLKRWEWDGSGRVEVDTPTEVAVLACDYVEGKSIGGWSAEAKADPDLQHAEVVFSKIGLTDLGGKNVIKTDDHYYIIDAAEDMLPVGA